MAKAQAAVRNAIQLALARLGHDRRPGAYIADDATAGWFPGWGVRIRPGTTSSKQLVAVDLLDGWVRLVSEEDVPPGCWFKQPIASALFQRYPAIRADHERTHKKWRGRAGGIAVVDLTIGGLDDLCEELIKARHEASKGLWQAAEARITKATTLDGRYALELICRDYVLPPDFPELPPPPKPLPTRYHYERIETEEVGDILHVPDVLAAHIFPECVRRGPTEELAY